MRTTEIKRGEFNAYYMISKFKPMMELNLSIFNRDANN